MGAGESSIERVFRAIKQRATLLHKSRPVVPAKAKGPGLAFLQTFALRHLQKLELADGGPVDDNVPVAGKD